MRFVLSLAFGLVFSSYSRMYVAVNEENVIRGYDLEVQGDPSRGSLFLVAGSSFAQVGWGFKICLGVY